MNFGLVVFLLAKVIFTKACPDPQTTIHIQNYDGPIYVTSEKTPICHQSTSSDNPTIHHEPKHGGDNPTIFHQSKPTCDSPNYHCHAKDCKCTTKSHGTVSLIPINTVSQVACGYYPYGYPDGYGYGYYEGGKSSDLYPLLKTLTQGCPKSVCNNYSGSY